MGKIKTFFILLLLATVGLAQGSLPWPKDGTKIYVVKPGDTLWNITDRFFGDPFLWPRLWEINPYIDNPHVIRPGDIISLTDLPVVKIEPGKKKQPLIDIEPPSTVYFFSPAGSEGFIAPGRWDHTGTILTSDPPKILLGEGDTVYVNAGAAQGIKPGDRFTVYRTSKEVIHPVKGNKVGYKVAVLGEIEIVEILGNRQSAAVITSSYREITRGARIRPSTPVVREVVLKSGHKPLQGFIVADMKNLTMSARGDVVYIDLGKRQGIRPGHSFSIFTHPRKSFDPDTRGSVRIPGTRIGRLIVLGVQDDTATTVIVESRRQIANGSVVVLEK